MAYIIDGKKISQEIKDELKAEVAVLISGKADFKVRNVIKGKEGH